MLARINSGNYRGVVTLQSRKLAENKAFLAFCTESRILRHQGFGFAPKPFFFLENGGISTISANLPPSHNGL